jgi:hypothetical protein
MNFSGNVLIAITFKNCFCSVPVIVLNLDAGITKNLPIIVAQIVGQSVASYHDRTIRDHSS